jgi:hypothetical protein
MSTRLFCDNCGKQMSGDPTYFLDSIVGGVMFRINYGFNAVGEGEVCVACLFDAIATLDNRPKRT